MLTDQHALAIAKGIKTDLHLVAAPAGVDPIETALQTHIAEIAVHLSLHAAVEIRQDRLHVDMANKRLALGSIQAATHVVRR